MKLQIRKEKLSLILGSLTLILFSIKPYILDIIEPAKSIGKIIGENANDLIKSLNGESKTQNTSHSKREIWSNIITIITFILFVSSIVFSVISFQMNSNKMYAIAGGVLSIIGLAIYLSHLAIGLIGFIVIATLVVIIVLLGGS